jgi:hypothetical protein
LHPVQNFVKPLPRCAQSGRGTFFNTTSWFWLLLIATVVVYLRGLQGPFLFDDPPNILFPLKAWLAGDRTWRQIVFGNGSGLLGRPISMLSFLLNASASGLRPLPFKATNLAIHLCCGTLLYALLSRILIRDPQLAARAKTVALLITAIWLLHPMQVSTVLYVVQRMAQLSTMFMLAALLGYVIARKAFEQGHPRIGTAWLFLFVPVATLAAMFSKENGALIPLLCAVIELGYFKPIATRRPRAIKLFFFLTLLLPGAVALAWFAANPSRLLGGYDGRLFTLGERLLSEPRALMDYIGALMLPRGPSLGIYTDDFVTSHGLLDPPSTLLAIVGLAAFAFMAWKLRYSAPAAFTGFFFFLAGHAMESTVFPLELYFEHRNYLPSAGLFLALVGFIIWGVSRLSPHTDKSQRTQRIVIAGTCAMLMLLALATFARANVWRSWATVAEQGAREHPESLRAQLDYSVILQLDGRAAEVQKVFDHLTTLSNPAARNVGAIDSMSLQCMMHKETTEIAIEKVKGVSGSRLQLPEMLAFENFDNYLQSHDCKNLTKSQLADMMVRIVEAAPQPETSLPLWRTRFNAARLYLADGYPDKAREQAARAWMTGNADVSIGLFLANLYFLNDDPKSAHLVLKDLTPRISARDTQSRRYMIEMIDHFEHTGKDDNRTLNEP